MILKNGAVGAAVKGICRKIANKVKVKQMTLIICLPLVISPIAIPDPIQELTSQKCLLANIFFEARGETLAGMKAIAAVTYNRVQAIEYPDTVCRVVFQPKQFSWTHQQSYMEFTKIVEGNLTGYQPKDITKYQLAVKVSQMPRKEFLKILPAQTKWYHNKDVDPGWNSKMKKTATIGSHIFYEKTLDKPKAKH